MGDCVREWIKGDENAKCILKRVFKDKPLLTIKPLNRVPLRIGNILEIVGPPFSSKTHILLQASLDCILPKEWNGIKYGGLEHMVMFIDLDCRFDVLRLAQLLKHRIIEGYGSGTSVKLEQGDASFLNCELKDPDIEYNKELFAACMRRFLYIRCYDTSEFLATLKTLHYQLRKEKETHGNDIHFLMIDSIGAFYWPDRASAALAATAGNRKTHSLQIVYETIVQEIRKLILVHPMLVLATKAANLYQEHEGKRIIRSHYSSRASDKSSSYTIPYREFMPSIWQSFVTHRVLVRATEDVSQHKDQPVYSSQWLLPSLSQMDKFTLTDVKSVGTKTHCRKKCIIGQSCWLVYLLRLEENPCHNEIAVCFLQLIILIVSGRLNNVIYFNDGENRPNKYEKAHTLKNKLRVVSTEFGGLHIILYYIDEYVVEYILQTHGYLLW